MGSEYRRAQDVLGDIAALEARGEVFRPRIDGWCVWPTLRYWVFMELSRLPMAAGAGRTSRWRRLGAWAGGAASAWRRIRKAAPGGVLVKTYASARREIEDGRAKDVYFDELLKRTPGHFKVETRNTPRFHRQGRNALFPSQMDAAPIETTAGILAKLWRPPAVKRAAAELTSCLAAAFPTMGPMGERVAQTLARFYWERRAYLWLLRRLKPSAVWVADNGEWALLAAARETGAPVFEFQHGVVDDGHPNALSAACAAWKSVIPRPHRLLVYGPHWKEALQKAGFYDEEIVVVGSILLDSYRDRAAARRLREFGRERVVVLTTQGVDREPLMRWAVRLMDLAREKVPVRLFIKTHPSYETDAAAYRARFRGDPRVIVVGGNEEPATLDLIARADWHISISSTCHYDALGLGVPTVVLGLTTHDVVDVLRTRGHAVFASSAEELADRVLGEAPKPVPADVSKAYFCPGALEATWKAVRAS